LNNSFPFPPRLGRNGSFFSPPFFPLHPHLACLIKPGIGFLSSKVLHSSRTSGQAVGFVLFLFFFFFFLRIRRISGAIVSAFLRSLFSSIMRSKKKQSYPPPSFLPPKKQAAHPFEDVLSSHDPRHTDNRRAFPPPLSFRR